MKELNATERRMRLRAAWAYSGLEQNEIADRAAIPFPTLKGFLAIRGTRSPTIDHMLSIGRACGVPDSFMLYGFPRDDQVEVRAAVMRLAAGQLRLTRELQERHETGRIAARAGGGRRGNG